jgi:hypothetical protein
VKLPATRHGRLSTAHTVSVVANVPKRWHRSALLALGLILAFVGGPVALFNGVRAIDRGSMLSTIGGWFMIVGGVGMVLGGGLTLLGLLRGKPSE